MLSKVTECIEVTSTRRQFISAMVETNMSSSMTLSWILSVMTRSASLAANTCLQVTAAAAAFAVPSLPRFCQVRNCHALHEHRFDDEKMM